MGFIVIVWFWCVKITLTSPLNPFFERRLRSQDGWQTTYAPYSCLTIGLDPSCVQPFADVDSGRRNHFASGATALFRYSIIPLLLFTRSAASSLTPNQLVSDTYVGSLSSSMFAGMMIGAVGWGTCTHLYLLPAAYLLPSTQITPTPL